VVAPEGANAADVLAPYEVLAATGAFNLYTVAPQRQPVPLTGGLDLVPDLSLGQLDQRLPEGPDVIVVPQVSQVPSGLPPSVAPVIAWLQRQRAQGDRLLVGVCVGAEVLAEAGLLDGRRATTHWGFAQELQKRHPLVQVQPDRIFINDGPVWTSAGMTAGIDMVLALVEQDLGAEIARAVAKKMVVYYRRPGGQSQFSAMLELEPQSDRIQKTLAHARAHLREPLSVEDLADVAHLSPRQFSRAFKAETGQSPAQAVENLRVEAARTMIDAGELALGVVAREAGFGDPERMRRAFLRTLGQPPQSIRRSARLMA
jgi:transcriptional regulator GlxA family with amidase domain